MNDGMDPDQYVAAIARQVVEHMRDQEIANIGAAERAATARAALPLRVGETVRYIGQYREDSPGISGHPPQALWTVVDGPMLMGPSPYSTGGLDLREPYYGVARADGSMRGRTYPYLPGSFFAPALPAQQ